jgi:hypothetical protein
LFQFGGWLLGLEKLFIFTKKNKNKNKRLEKQILMSRFAYMIGDMVENETLIFSLIPPNSVTKAAANV